MPDRPRLVKKNQPKNELELKKGQILVVKAPPYYDKEYLYEITSAGDKQVRANLYKSPRVRKAWGREELTILADMGIVRAATDQDMQKHAAEKDPAERDPGSSESQ